MQTGDHVKTQNSIHSGGFLVGANTRTTTPKTHTEGRTHDATHHDNVGYRRQSTGAIDGAQGVEQKVKTAPAEGVKLGGTTNVAYLPSLNASMTTLQDVQDGWAPRRASVSPPNTHPAAGPW